MCFFKFDIHFFFISIKNSERIIVIEVKFRCLYITHHIAVQSKCTMSHLLGLNAMESAYSIP